MPKGATYALAWSSSQQAYVLTEGEGLVPLRIVLDSPAWFAWLAQAPAFAFTGKSGSYTARKETRHGEGYWYAYLRTGEKLSKKYLGKTSGLAVARLEDIVRKRPVPAANPASAQSLSGCSGRPIPSSFTTCAETRRPAKRHAR